MLPRFAAGLFALTVVILAVAAVRLGPTDTDPADVERAGAAWVGVGTAQPPRRDGDEWEVDVRRPDGSLIEVTIGEGLELRGFDEERGPAGARAPDELEGEERARPARAALRAVGPATVVSVEREMGGELEVGVVRPNGARVEVSLDRRMRVTEVEPEDRGDE